MGRFKRVEGRGSRVEGLRQSGAAGQLSTLDSRLSSKWRTTSLHGPVLTSLGLAWRRSRAVPSSLMASLKLAGGLAFTSAPSSAAASSIEATPRLIAIRRADPSVLIASG